MIYSRFCGINILIFSSDILLVILGSEEYINIFYEGLELPSRYLMSITENYFVCPPLNSNREHGWYFYPEMKRGFIFEADSNGCGAVMA